MSHRLETFRVDRIGEFAKGARIVRLVFGFERTGHHQHPSVTIEVGVELDNGATVDAIETAAIEKAIAVLLVAASLTSDELKSAREAEAARMAEIFPPLNKGETNG